MSEDLWTDHDGTSLHRDGHKVGLFMVEGDAQWWAYPAGWKPRGAIEPKGPFRSRRAAKMAMDPANWQNWTTPAIDFKRQSAGDL